MIAQEQVGGVLRFRADDCVGDLILRDVLPTSAQTKLSGSFE